MFLRYTFALCLTALSVGLHAQEAHETMYVQGNTLYDKCGSPVVLHGVNYPVLDDWSFPATSEVSAQIEQSGANAVRIQWYINYGQNRPAYALKDLDTVISRIARLDMIPIVELHDYTCQSGFGELAANVVPWYTQADMLALIDKHKAYLIINFANEYGAVNWAADPAAAQNSFQTAYGNAVNAMRTAGIDVPLMIDAPDCGTSSNRLLNVASALRAADPQDNLIFSVHAYWYGYANNDSLTMRNHIQQMANSGSCFMLGEVANFQDDNGTYCTYALNYTSILRSAESFKVGWLIWSWYKDGCAARQMTTAGNFASLTPFGQNVIHNSVFGLKTVAQRSPYLVNNGCTPLGVEETAAHSISVFPNPATGYIQVQGPVSETALYTLADIAGRTVYAQRLTGASVTISVEGLPQGWYTLNRNGKFLKKIIVQH